MSQNCIKTGIEKIAVRQALKYVRSNPEENLPKLLDWVDQHDRGNDYVNQRKAFHNLFDHPEGNWYQLLMSVWKETDPRVLESTFVNFIVNATLSGAKTRENYRQKYGCGIPWAILMDPTSACNLHCTGCWAADYGNKLNMNYKTLDSIIRQGTKMGTYFYIYSGGEPLIRKADILRLCEAHPDCQFLAFTNGTLIDDEFADGMLHVKNFIPAISVEGFEDATDSRRGDGTYRKVLRAMSVLKTRHLPFGISCCYTSKNTEVIGSEAYFDKMIDMGARFAWFFTYMPVGKDAVPELMATAEQREFMYRQIRAFRKTKPIFTMDFWNDGEYVQGCIAGGRSYLHINAAGDIEPCAFIHYSDSSIYSKTLLEAYRAPLFMAYHDGQPFNQNHLRPCPLLDNPGALTGMVERSGAKSTDIKAPENVRDLSAKCTEKAEKWAVTADRLWTCSHGCAACKEECAAGVKKS